MILETKGQFVTMLIAATYLIGGISLLTALGKANSIFWALTWFTGYGVGCVYLWKLADYIDGRKK